MTQVSKRLLNKDVENKIQNLFLEIISQTKDRQSASVFSQIFFSSTEKAMFCKRLAVFFLLAKNVSGVEIAEILKMSSATISKIKILFDHFSQEEKSVFIKLIAKKNMTNLLADIVKAFYYGPLPPKGANWSEWRKNKAKWENELKNPLR